MRLFNLLKQLSVKIKDLAYRLGLIKDYVVEQGTNGIWRYRKWNSGVAECWGRLKLTPKGTLVAWGSTYYVTVDGTAYPFTFVDVPTETVQVSTSNYWVIQRENTATTTSSLYLVRPTTLNVTNFPVAINYVTKGRWK